MKIVKATRKNIKEIAEILFEEFKKPPFNEKVSFNAVLKSLDFYFKIGNVYTAINESEIAGVVIFKIEQYWEGQVIIIEDLAVKEIFKNYNVNKILINKVESYAKNKHIRSIYFSTNKKSSALKIYKKQGYKLEKKYNIYEKENRVIFSKQKPWQLLKEII
ncbi:GNAT family N-acetyltransferase [Candidatus Woesearchaeota archaeon]|nr:GNAT family N-acetyltransferase [Candidatus Woesearchaeota archaeon]